MTKIPAETKADMISFGTNARFTKFDSNFRELNAGIVGLVKKAIANQIADDQPYTFQINFRNGMIVGQTFDLASLSRSSRVVALRLSSH